MRGTFVPQTPRHRNARLIPARAGNIGTDEWKKKVTAAHPRSRGEHTLPFTVPRLLVGSSPLTRGTPYLDVAEVACGGLIPARAGNILRAAAKLSRARAHPRSRGEHSTLGELLFAPTGSSPLARGTPTWRWALCRLSGLIPARAGNTGLRSSAMKPIRAHPRSRGEHWNTIKRWRIWLGSSPLARGTQKRV